MAKMKLISNRLKASSLIEVTVAMVIISMVFSFAVVIYVNVERAGFATRKFGVDVALDKVFNEARDKKQFVNQVFQMEGMTIYQDVKPHSEVKNIFLIRLEAREESGKLIAERKYIVHDTVSVK